MADNRKQAIKDLVDLIHTSCIQTFNKKLEHTEAEECCVDGNIPHEMPNETGTMPCETGKLPSEIGTTPDDSGKLTRETGTTPNETGNLPRETDTTLMKLAICHVKLAQHQVKLTRCWAQLLLAKH